MINIGDIIFQLIAIIIPVLSIAAVVFFIRSSKKKTEQLDRIEEKLDRAIERTIGK
ncbi:DUF4083 family protein [Mesobacillus harenae]|uniref:DUF4083 family protein n=1 Tax=Mesobacillus harenae TaxID=2213203 RepID=UPI0018D782F8|nr:DUF4083 family protein [Mesobacillus harenae]